MRSLPPHLRLLAIAAALGCSGSGRTRPHSPQPELAVPLTEPNMLCVRPGPADSCRRADVIEGWLQDPGLEILAVDDTPAGVQLTKVLTLRVATGDGPVVFRAKWRPIGHDNRRRELAAYVIQSMFLEPHEYVVPPASGHCFAIETYRERADPDAEPSFPGVRCVYGILQYWLENVTSLPDAQEAGWFTWGPSGLFDEELWEENDVYRDSLARMNLLAYLIDHRDTHWQQFLLRDDPSAPVVYSVDNSLSFDANQNTGLGPHDWSNIKVPALPRAAVERLRGMSIDRLEILEQLRRVDGVLIEEPPSAPAGPPDSGYHWVGNRVKVRLKEQEITALQTRLETLLERIDRGEIPLY